VPYGVVSDNTGSLKRIYATSQPLRSGLALSDAYIIIQFSVQFTIVKRIYFINDDTHFFTVDNNTYKCLKNIKWRVQKSAMGTLYAVTYYYNKKVKHERMFYAHKMILNITTPLCVDHIDGNTLNNCKSNLRACTKSQNTMNRKRASNNSSGFKGVGVLKNGKFYARIARTIKGKSVCKHLGTFVKIEEAAKAYDNEAIKQFGNFSKLNFPNL
jgi:hypothetical protein